MHRYSFAFKHRILFIEIVFYTPQYRLKLYV